MILPARLRTACRLHALVCRLFALSLVAILLLPPMAPGLIEAPEGGTRHGGVTIGSGAVTVGRILDDMALDKGWTPERRREARAEVNAYFAADRTRALWLALGLALPVLPLAGAAWLGGRFLSLAAAGAAFSAEAARGLRRAAVLAGAAILLAPVGMGVAKLLYGTALRRPGEPVPLDLTLSLSPGTLMLLLPVLLPWLLARILEEGARLRAESESFV